MSTFGHRHSLEFATHGSNLGKLVPILETGVPSIWESAVIKFQSICSSVSEPETPKVGNLQFQAWEALIPIFGNQQFLEL